jgi:hypothetical protein
VNAKIERRKFITLLGGAAAVWPLVTKDIHAAPAYWFEKAEIIEREWAKARAKNPKVVMRVTVHDETDEGGKPRINVVIAF